MRKIAAISFCVIVVALVYTFAQAQQRYLLPQQPQIVTQQPQVVTVTPSQTAWEYTALSFPDGQIQQFTNLGNQGWELVAVAPSQSMAMQVTTYIAYFKRPRLR